MNGWNKFNDDYFLRYSEKPVKLKPYNPKQTEIANKYLIEIKRILGNRDAKLIIRGSTAFKIQGKGDIEVGVYPHNTDWEQTVSLLTDVYGQPMNIEEDYVRFNQIYDGFDVEIILLKSHEAEVDLALTEYLLRNPAILKQYEKVKQKYAFSKREYQIQKNIFLSNIISQIPDGEHSDV